MKMEQSVPKSRHIKFRPRGITQKKGYNKRKIFFGQNLIFRNLLHFSLPAVRFKDISSMQTLSLLRNPSFSAHKHIRRYRFHLSLSVLIKKERSRNYSSQMNLLLNTVNLEQCKLNSPYYSHQHFVLHNIHFFCVSEKASLAS